MLSLRVTHGEGFVWSLTYLDTTHTAWSYNLHLKLATSCLNNLFIYYFLSKDYLTYIQASHRKL